MICVFQLSAIPGDYAVGHPATPGVADVWRTGFRFVLTAYRTAYAVR